MSVKDKVSNKALKLEHPKKVVPKLTKECVKMYKYEYVYISIIDYVSISPFFAAATTRATSVVAFWMCTGH